MIMSGNDSLAALTTAASSLPTSASVSSSRGIRALGNARLLELDDQNALQVPALRNPPIFECPFNFLYCLVTFASFTEWFTHSLTHFHDVGPPWIIVR